MNIPLEHIGTRKAWCFTMTPALPQQAQKLPAVQQQHLSRFRNGFLSWDPGIINSSTLAVVGVGRLVKPLKIGVIFRVQMLIY